jgi:DNA repair protein RecO (recombination protein O)
MSASQKHPLLQGWLLHSRPYRDSSLLLDFFTLEEGKVSALARGVRSSKSGKRSLLQPFIPLQISLGGKGELRTLAQVEALSVGSSLTKERLMSGLYINELLVRLLPSHEAESLLFTEYGKLMQELAGSSALEPLLRCFELLLLEALGYGLQLTHDAETGEVMHAGALYHLHADGGMVRQLQTTDGADAQGASLYAGADLIGIAARDFSGESTRKTAKRLLRTVLQQHLGTRELGSRALFIKPAR